jgi:hypothetical protein
MLDPLNTTAVPPQQNAPTYLASNQALPDTAATAHYLTPTAERHCTYAEITKKGPTVRVTSGHTLVATKQVQIPLAKELSSAATTGHIFPNLQSGSLVSIGQLCDDNCVALFAKSDMAIYKDGAIIIRGKRDATNGLWSMPLDPSTSPPPATTPTKTHHANSVLQSTKTKADLAAFLHACAFSPVPSTFLRAIKRGHFDN